MTLIFDGLTAYMVNHLDDVNTMLNRICHLIFLTSIDSFIFIQFLYLLHSTRGFPKKLNHRLLLFLPYLLNISIVIFFIDSLEYIHGNITNYSMGISAYTCFFMAAIYILFTFILFIKYGRDIESHKRVSILTYLSVSAGVTIFQMIIPEALITSVGITVLILGIYLNLEEPAIKGLENYHREMVMGFAT